MRICTGDMFIYHPLGLQTEGGDIDVIAGVARWGQFWSRGEDSFGRAVRTPATWEKWAPVTFATHIPSVSSTTLIPSVS